MIESLRYKLFPEFLFTEIPISVHMYWFIAAGNIFNCPFYFRVSGLVVLLRVIYCNHITSRRYSSSVAIVITRFCRSPRTIRCPQLSSKFHFCVEVLRSEIKLCGFDCQ
jgi:hypothetical protein